MSKRYGRNQRRAHRAEIERLGELARELQRKADNARVAANLAYSKAAADLLSKSEYIDAAIREITYQLAHKYPEDLAEAAEQILKARREAPPIRFDATVQPDWSSAQQIVVIRGEIPALRYNVAIR